MPSNYYESIACEFLAAKGLSLIERNYSWHGGEIDIIARHGSELVFAEVKFREDDDHGSPFEHITPAQIRRIHATAQIYLEANSQFDHTHFRFDALGLQPLGGNRARALFACETFRDFQIEWIQHGF